MYIVIVYIENSNSFYKTLKDLEKRGNCNFILVDNSNKLKGHDYDDWYKTYVYKLSDIKPDKPTSNDPNNPGDGWVDYPNTTGQWWQCIGTVNGVTELVTEWSEVLPVNGQDGTAQDGKRVEFRFAVNSSQTDAPAINKSIRQPSGWTTQPPTKEANQFMWMTVATINPDDTLAVNWSDPVCISGEQGPQGVKGETGETGATGPKGDQGVGIESITHAGNTTGVAGTMDTYFINLSNGDSYPIVLSNGSDGNHIIFGNGEPENITDINFNLEYIFNPCGYIEEEDIPKIIGNKGDVYINLLDGSVFEYTSE